MENFSKFSQIVKNALYLKKKSAHSGDIYFLLSRVKCYLLVSNIYIERENKVKSRLI